MAKYYTGVGSRETPAEVLFNMRYLAKELALMGYTLRSGGAKGSDSAFEEGCDAVSGSKEIYLPVPKFNGSDSKLLPSMEAYRMAAQIHPAWSRCTSFARKAHARNIHQVLGEDLKTPSEFLICWTRGGVATGGTATAINLAVQNNIPVFNLFSREYTVKEIIK